MAKAPLTPLLLHAVVGAEHDAPLSSPSLQLVTFRDIAAVVHPVPGLAREELTTPERLVEHRMVLESLQRQGAVLPAPPGVLARDRTSLLRWMEVHFIALSEALAFVDGRWGARVHVTRAPAAASSQGPLDVPPLDLDGVATELFRTLRRHAAASCTLRHPETEVERASAAFLVESERWDAFADAVAAEGRRDAGVRVQLTGPWPPFDFVKMQFGG